jgi:hypothetical protein
MKKIKMKMTCVDDKGNDIGSYTFENFNFKNWINQPFFYKFHHYQTILKGTRNGKSFITYISHGSLPIDFGKKRDYHSTVFTRI